MLIHDILYHMSFTLITLNYSIFHYSYLLYYTMQCHRREIPCSNVSYIWSGYVKFYNPSLISPKNAFFSLERREKVRILKAPKGKQLHIVIDQSRFICDD